MNRELATVILGISLTSFSTWGQPHGWDSVPFTYPFLWCLPVSHFCHCLPSWSVNTASSHPDTILESSPRPPFTASNTWTWKEKSSPCLSYLLFALVLGVTFCHPFFRTDPLIGLIMGTSDSKLDSTSSHPPSLVSFLPWTLRCYWPSLNALGQSGSGQNDF